MTSAEYKSVIRLDTVLLPSRRERMEFLLIASDVQVRGTYEVAYTSYSRVCPPSLALACAKSKIVARGLQRAQHSSFNPANNALVGPDWSPHPHVTPSANQRCQSFPSQFSPAQSQGSSFSCQQLLVLP